MRNSQTSSCDSGSQNHSRIFRSSAPICRRQNTICLHSKSGLHALSSHVHRGGHNSRCSSISTSYFSPVAPRISKTNVPSCDASNRSHAIGCSFALARRAAGHVSIYIIFIHLQCSRAFILRMPALVFILGLNITISTLAFRAILF